MHRAIRWFLQRFRPSVAIKYHYTDKEAEGLIIKLEEKLKSGRGTLEVIGLGLTQSLFRKVLDVSSLKKEMLSEEFLFKGQEGTADQK
jgi:hypothetical protein